VLRKSRGPEPLLPAAAAAAVSALTGCSTNSPGLAAAVVPGPIGVAENSPELLAIGVEPGIGASAGFGGGDWAKAPETQRAATALAQTKVRPRRAVAGEYPPGPGEVSG